MTDSPSTGLTIDDAVVTRVNNSLADGLPMIIAYVNGSGQPRLSFRGSIHVHSKDQLALWARDPEGGLLSWIKSNPKVTLLYRDPATRSTLTFYGRARAEEDPAIREQIYNETPEPERKNDPEREGKAVIVDLDQIQGRTPEGRVDISRT